MLITGERHVRLILNDYAGHYDTHRPHRALQQNPSSGRAHPSVDMPGMRILRRDRIGGFIHEYAQVARGDRISGTPRFLRPSRPDRAVSHWTLARPRTGWPGRKCTPRVPTMDLGGRSR
jgi:hypothetical protein